MSLSLAVKKLVKYVRLTFYMFRANLASALSFRFSFVLYIIGVSAFVGGQFFIWSIFFGQFPELGGWTVRDVQTTYALFIFCYAIINLFFGGILELAEAINRGQLDGYLTYPKPILWQVAVSKADMADVATLVLSSVVFLWAAPFSLIRLMLFLLAAGLATPLIFNFVVITQSLTFFVGGFEEGARAVRHLLIIVAPYPFRVFSSPFKYLLMTIIPSFFVVTLPASLIDTFSYRTLAVLIAVLIASTIVAHLVFAAGLRRYESGNLINVKM